VADSSEEVPQGLVVPGLKNETRRGSLLSFLTVAIISGLALIWPVYPFAGSIRPYLFGLPFSFVWVVGWLVVMFVALVLLYRTDEPAPTD
jgi:hypothetical protein